VFRAPRRRGGTSRRCQGCRRLTARGDSGRHDERTQCSKGLARIVSATPTRGEGCLNELVLDIVPVVLRDGERIFDDVPEFHAEAIEAATSPLATHIVYKIT
jgi:hypothetical protein